jgi:ribosomal-protein-alanine N-acetyltransferase
VNVVAAHARSTREVPVVIAPMRRRHLRGVLGIEERTSSTPWSLGLFLAEAKRQERTYLVARSGHRVVGFAGMLYVLSDGHVTTVAVDPDRQGGGIGTRLMLVLMRRAIERGVEAVTLEVRQSNDPALALYRRFGFAPAGVRKGYYRDPVEDAIVLWAHDVHLPEYATRLEAIEVGLPTPLLSEGLAPWPPPAPEPPEDGTYL